MRNLFARRIGQREVERAFEHRHLEASLLDEPFNQIEPERKITIDEAMEILNKYRRPQN